MTRMAKPTIPARDKQLPFPEPAPGQPEWGSPQNAPPSADPLYLRRYFARRHWAWMKVHDPVQAHSVLSRPDGGPALLRTLLAKGEEASLEYQRQRRRNIPHLEADKRVIADVVAPEVGGETPDPLPASLTAQFEKSVAAFEKHEAAVLMQSGLSK
jgi:hypothetical protein